MGANAKLKLERDMTVRDFKKEDAAYSDDDKSGDQKYESEMAEMMRELVNAKLESQETSEVLEKSSTDLAVLIEEENSTNHSMTAKQIKSDAKNKKNSRNDE